MLVHWPTFCGFAKFFVDIFWYFSAVPSANPYVLYFYSRRRNWLPGSVDCRSIDVHFQVLCIRFGGYYKDRQKGYGGRNLWYKLRFLILVTVRLLWPVAAPPGPRFRRLLHCLEFGQHRSRTRWKSHRRQALARSSRLRWAVSRYLDGWQTGSFSFLFRLQNVALVELAIGALWNGTESCARHGCDRRARRDNPTFCANFRRDVTLAMPMGQVTAPMVPPHPWRNICPSSALRSSSATGWMLAVAPTPVNTPPTTTAATPPVATVRKTPPVKTTTPPTTLRNPLNRCKCSRQNRRNSSELAILVLSLAEVTTLSGRIAHDDALLKDQYKHFNNYYPYTYNKICRTDLLTDHTNCLYSALLIKLYTYTVK